MFNFVDKRIYAFTGFQLEEGEYALLEEIEVPNEIIDQAVRIAQLNEELNQASVDLYIDVLAEPELSKKIK